MSNNIVYTEVALRHTLANTFTNTHTWHEIPHVNMYKLSHIDANIQTYTLLAMEGKKPAQMEWNETAG